MDRVILKFDGRYDWIKGENRQWTVLSTFIDLQGNNRTKGSFMLKQLKELGIVPKGAR